MKKEELIKLIETLELEEIKSLKIVYYTEKIMGCMTIEKQQQ
jgi:hypothetical protein